MVRFKEIILHPVTAVAIMMAGLALGSFVLQPGGAPPGNVQSLCVHMYVQWTILIPSAFMMFLGTAILVYLTWGYVGEFRESIGPKKKNRKTVKMRMKRR